MEPTHILSDEEREDLLDCLSAVDKNPYDDYSTFAAAIRSGIERGAVPDFFVTICERIRAEREAGVSDAHVLRNCPIDDTLPVFDQDDPVAAKYREKTTFVGEALLELFGQLTGTPLLAYSTRNNGDFFHDVYAVNRYSGTQTQKTDGELYFHNDRTAHPVRADFLALLGMRCPEEDLVYTGYIDGRDLLRLLDDKTQEVLRERWFVTPYDLYSADSNTTQTVSDEHAVLENDHSFRYYDTRTTTAPDAPVEALKALVALKNAIVTATRSRHRILAKDLLIVANQDGLHCREMIEVNDPERTRLRWLLKTYAFRDAAAAARHEDRWRDGVAGLVVD